jgi:hypothetical protein
MAWTVADRRPGQATLGLDPAGFVDRAEPGAGVPAPDLQPCLQIGGAAGVQVDDPGLVALAPVRGQGALSFVPVGQVQLGEFASTKPAAVPDGQDGGVPCPGGGGIGGTRLQQPLDLVDPGSAGVTWTTTRCKATIWNGSGVRSRCWPMVSTVNRALSLIEEFQGLQRGDRRYRSLVP